MKNHRSRLWMQSAPRAGTCDLLLFCSIFEKKLKKNPLHSHLCSCSRSLSPLRSNSTSSESPLHSLNLWVNRPCCASPLQALDLDLASGAVASQSAFRTTSRLCTLADSERAPCVSASWLSRSPPPLSTSQLLHSNWYERFFLRPV